MMTIEVTVLVTMMAAICGIVFGILNLRKAKATETKNDASSIATLIAKLENIVNILAEIKAEIASLKAENKEARERIVILEQSMKAAWKQLDTVCKECKYVKISD